MSYVEAGRCWKEKIIGKGFTQRSYRKGFERYNMGKGSARHREGIGKALETGIGRHREGIGKQSGKHPKASVRHREGTGKASESIGKASGKPEDPIPTKPNKVQTVFIFGFKAILSENCSVCPFRKTHIIAQ